MSAIEQKVMQDLAPHYQQVLKEYPCADCTLADEFIRKGHAGRFFRCECDELKAFRKKLADWSAQK